MYATMSLIVLAMYPITALRISWNICWLIHFIVKYIRQHTHKEQCLKTKENKICEFIVL